MAEIKKNTVIINGEECTLKAGVKAMLIFEKECKKAFEIITTTDVMRYVHASILAGTKDCKLSFDEMVDAFDEEPDLIQKCTDSILGTTSLEEVVRVSHEADEAGEPKKD